MAFRALLLAVALLTSPAPMINVDGAPAQGALLRGTAPAGTVALTLDGRPVPLAPTGASSLVSTGTPAPRPC
jgi:hypothetical protein